MYPMDFEEFAIANGVQSQTFDVLNECFEKKTAVPTAIHNKMLELFRYYIIIGGMPAVVQTFVDTHDIGKTLNLQQDILELYRQDITKYAKNEKMRIKSIFDKIPAELSESNRRFVLTDISKSARMNRYESSFMWLADAGVSLPCYNVAEPVEPLKINEKSSLFKLFLCDVGLLCAASLSDIQFSILQGDMSVNMGSIYENVFAQEFVSSGFELRYMNKKGLGEIDFVLRQGSDILPIEVKSGSDFKAHRALDKVMAVGEWGIKRAIVFSTGNVEDAEKITYLPCYMSMFLRQSMMPPHLVVEFQYS
jgi:predicted AAA+ superfamily ATPase